MNVSKFMNVYCSLGALPIEEEVQLTAPIQFAISPAHSCPYLASVPRCKLTISQSSTTNQLALATCRFSAYPVIRKLSEIVIWSTKTTLTRIILSWPLLAFVILQMIEYRVLSSRVHITWSYFKRKGTRAILQRFLEGLVPEIWNAKTEWP